MNIPEVACDNLGIFLAQKEQSELSCSMLGVN